MSAVLFDTDTTIFEKLDEEMDVPCDAAGVSYMPKPHGPARWIAHTKCPGCGGGGQHLLCTSCKEFALVSELTMHCNFHPEVSYPLHQLFHLIEAL